jgi:trimeric autotransporter adhesin
MLMVNANVVTTEAYRQLVTGLCPDTYYEFSAWVKNICKRCAIDSNSVNTYRPGVYPNLSFSINGLDMYSTGFLDTTGWQKKGFIFKTGPGQTAALLSIRNNASGGGGNDWVLDDLSIGTCGPVMRLNYMPVFLGCGLGTLVNLSDTIKYSFNPTYSWYKWERSTDGGLTWTDPPTPAFGQATPVLVGGFYQYVTNYPPFVAFTADSGHRYRVVVANSLANLSNPSCYFTDGNHTFLRIINCGTVLPTNFISFTGTLTASNKVSLQWLVNGEKDIVQYAVEYSADGSRFTTAGNIKAQQNPLQAMYDYTDAGNALLPAYYRIKMMNAAGLYRYSKTILLSNKYSFSVQGVPNPFTNSISADIILPKDGLVKMWLMDSHGKNVATAQVKMYRGLNKFVSQPLAHLSSGIYVALWEYDGLQVQRKLTKSQ